MECRFWQFVLRSGTVGPAMHPAVKYTEIDHEYKVPQGVEAYQTEKREGAMMAR
jgi:hypothetical protein